ncbi:cytokinin hydroxylase-like [Lycium barbarum]|uniref:cytokinin hydroxylase-like n=1 Tax=Lycium barbarum TaxID=112863 RepID=UPI00293F1330|nr:cytokinin hydroxylase-like [Lycium barbarum]
MIQDRIDMVEEIGRSSSYGNDLMGMLLDEMKNRGSSSSSGLSMNMQMIVDECKTFLFAGYEGTSLLLTWTVMLLACNPAWQDRVRAEVNQVCHGNPPTVDHLRKLLSLNMVIRESLRLYPPFPVLNRMALEDIKLRNGLLIPKGVSIWIPILAMHHSEEIWGQDANEFNPNRFASDASAEARRHFLPFAAGPRDCPSQYYALMEAKIILAMFISKFRFTISDNYRHAPVTVITLKPKHGVQINLESLLSL